MKLINKWKLQRNVTHKNVVLHSVATALASMVFPVPLGPYSSTPFQGASSPENSSGYLMGCTTASFNRRLACRKSTGQWVVRIYQY